MSEATPIDSGRLVLVVGPSGAGKDTLIGIAKSLCAGNPRIAFPRRVVTRPSSAFEDNLAMTPAEFDAAAGQGAFALTWRAHDHAYGIPREIDDEIRAGKTVVVNVSRTIIAEARQRYRNVTVVLITAPADVLAQRVAARKRASDSSVAERLRRAAMPQTAEPDIVISNVGSADEHGRELADVIAGEPLAPKPDVMSSYPRYAIYYVPAASDPLYRLGARTLGYDGFTGKAIEFPDELTRGVADWPDVSTDPRKYGFHATLKAPFALAPGRSEAELLQSFAAFVAPATPKIPLAVSSISSFIAVIPAAPSAELSDLAQSCVEAFDAFRAPLTEHDRARRRPDRLSARQLGYLDRWGYPYVADEFRFHMTLTGSLPRERHETIVPLLRQLFAPVTATPRPIDRIALFYQADAGARFRIIAERDLTGR